MDTTPVKHTPLGHGRVNRNTIITTMSITRRYLRDWPETLDITITGTYTKRPTTLHTITACDVSGSPIDLDDDEYSDAELILLSQI